MTNNKAKRVLALVLIAFILLTFILTVYFGFIGKTEIALSLLAFNGFFTVVVYFLMRLQRSINSSVEDETTDNLDELDESIINDLYDDSDSNKHN